jgi:hypothetical protein
MKIADDCPAAEWSTIELRQVGRCWSGETTGRRLVQQ